MEPSEFDQYIKDTLLQENDAHAHEIAQSKPFVWTAVQQALHAPSGLRWYHLAAAILLLLISSFFLFFSLEGKHQRELNALSQQVNALQQQYVNQSEQLDRKKEELFVLQDEMHSLEQVVEQLHQAAPAAVHLTPQLVYRTDTVFIKQVEYVTELVPEHPSDVPDSEGHADVLETKEEPPPIKDVVDDGMIYPSFASSKNRSASDQPIKVKLSQFTYN